MVRRGEVWWADLPEPRRSEPGLRRPVVVIQEDEFNKTRLRTVIVVPVTSNLELAGWPGNVLLATEESGLDKPSVALVTQLLAIDRSYLLERESALSPRLMASLDDGLRLVLNL